ncbi:integrase core domain-containing protein, partial [Parabacteroides distasonis]
CNQYIDRLQAIKATISMTEDYKPTDNAIAERVNGIIKQEWLYRMKRPPDVVVARDLLGRIIDFYNNRRPQRSNRDMLPPVRFREALTCM